MTETASSTRRVYWLWKYLPVLLPGFLVIIPWIIPHLGEPQLPTPSAAWRSMSLWKVLMLMGPGLARKAADIAFALISFWIWALTTNVHTGCYVCTGGEIKADRQNAKEHEAMEIELVFIIVFGCLTGITFLLCNTKDWWEMGLVATVLSLALPFIVLKRDSGVKK